MKAILIIDIPDKYKFSDFQEVITDLWFKGKNSFIRNYSYMHRGVELRPLPEKKELTNDLEQYVFAEGWNAYRKELLGEEE